jgi:hypothetical protein
MAIQLGRRRFEIRRGIAWFLIMLGALVSFELFNYSTTEYALGTFFGRHDTLGMASWATVLAIAFCGIDFAGLSRLFTPESDWHKEPKEIWFLTLAWFLGAAMNATMTWWAVTTALTENAILGNELVTRQQILHIVPVFVAVLVWLTRVMLIGSIATSGEHLFGRASARSAAITGRAAPLAAARVGRLAGDGRPPLPEPLAASRASTADNSRASSVRSYPRRESTPIPRYDQRRAETRSEPAALWQEPVFAQRRSEPRGGMPIGARARQTAPREELAYVDLE